MGGLFSTPDDSNGSNGGAPKSFYLVLGGPSIRYNRPGRGPLIFDVEPMSTNTEDLVEHAEVVRPTANVRTKQKFQLVPITPPNPTGYPQTTQWTFRLRFQIDYCASTPPQRVEVFLGTKIEYRQGEGILLVPRNGTSSISTAGSAADAFEIQRNDGSAAASNRNAPTRVMFKSSGFPTVTGSTDLTTVDMTQYCAEFTLADLIPALPKDQLATPCSLKECPIVIVVQFDVPPAQSRRPPAASSVAAAALLNGGTNASTASRSRTDSLNETVPEVTAVHRLYTFLSFDEKQVASLYGKTSQGVESPAAGGGARRRAQGDSQREPNGGTNDEDVTMTELRNVDLTLVKQYLEFSGEVYELDDIYDLGGDDLGSPANADPPGATPRAGGEEEIAAADPVEDDDEANTCVICLCNPKDTTVIPCRHLCLCAECAVQLRHQSNKCPICRRPIERLMTM
ncbi:zinc finger protein, putative [Bodo saltans]|uniref:Zinc finger protein, putative n=1 Tax=Bodo saltans TaxID=75058 RepID=A0A0S4ITU9_BODSA|nr:zinc finger protein, putative [Bodo saltans]|eukprot:CUE79115.1 zinc finger protein, putative [Bodo saltans]